MLIMNISSDIVWLRPKPSPRFPIEMGGVCWKATSGALWAKDMKIGYSMINARAETLQSKPAFRNLLSKNRIVIPADGFFY